MRVDPGLFWWRVRQWLERSFRRFLAAGGTRSAAAIAYRVLLSFFPLVLFVASIAGLVLKDPEVRADFVNALADALPVSASGASDIDAALRGVAENAAAVGVISLVTLLWTASGMMGAIRGGLDALYPDAPHRPWGQGKAIDLAMLLCAAILLAASAGLTIATRVARGDLERSVGFSGALFEAARIIVPIGIGAGLLLVLIRWVPSTAPRVRDAWPSALVGSTALWALSVGFAAFIDHFGHYNLLYGSLAAVVVFLYFVYLAAALVILSAAFAAELGGVRADRPVPGPPGPGVLREILGLLKGLVVRGKPPEENLAGDVDPDAPRSSRG